MGLRDWLLGKKEKSVVPASAPVRSTVAVVPPEIAARFVVIDVETTGLSPNGDRILELAVVHVDDRGGLVAEWVTRFNPEGPVGATHIHGITDADIADAPYFRDVAAEIARRIGSFPIAAHNARFDVAFLQAEFTRAGWDVPPLAIYCTLDGSRDHLPLLDRRRLVDCCWAARVQLTTAHSALGDARATAGLLGFYLAGAAKSSTRDVLTLLPDRARSTVWPSGPSRSPSTITVSKATTTYSRRFTPARPAQPPLLRQLTDVSLAEVLDEGAPEGSLPYFETLLEALEDGEINDDEAVTLLDLASLYELTNEHLRAAHQALLLALAHKAVDDGHVSHDERRELIALATALDVPDAIVQTLIAHADTARLARKGAGLRDLPEDWHLGEPLRVGDKIAFTGCEEPWRSTIERRAESLGVRVMGNVSRLTTLLVTDGSMDGTKLARAREVGTRVVDPASLEVLLQHLQPARPVTTPPPIARPAKPSPKAEPRTGAIPSAPPNEIRAWAIVNGHPVGVRGRISSDILEAYESAQTSTIRVP
ncbi:exonuclease domain-containing protein [Microbacterium sp. Root61]|uniref:exonuclease domain-containing protein n=1 Tax=Microbacterium sp. Root61 TaxID=1736570 RepID=UPI0009EBCDC3|nr:histone-like nucleoid-structuring protein Lsr2 [Microbacterium sp. Root61]